MWREVAAQGHQGKLFNCLAKFLGGKPPHVQQPSPSKGRCWFVIRKFQCSRICAKPALRTHWKWKTLIQVSVAPWQWFGVVVNNWRKSWLVFDLVFPMTFPCNVRWNLFPPWKDSWVNSQSNRPPKRITFKKGGFRRFFNGHQSSIKSLCINCIFNKSILLCKCSQSLTWCDLLL